jgi:hypothetical protein
MTKAEYKKWRARHIKTLDFGYLPIRKTHTEGRHLTDIELSDGTNAEVRSDWTTNQPFAVLFDEDWNPLYEA